MALNKLIIQQMNTGSLIERFSTNLKKTVEEGHTLHFYQGRLNLLESYWAKFNERHEATIILQGYAASDYAKNDYFTVIEEAYLEAQEYIKLEMEKCTSCKMSQNESLISGTTVTAARLPKLSLPTFSGSYLEWESFKDLFLNAVHNNPSLSNATRLQYLKAQLSGDAAKLISNVTITDANYLGAWKTLTDRYDNERIIVTHHLDRILSIKPLTTESAQNLRRILDTTSESLRALGNLNRPIQYWDDWFVHLTVKKLNITIRKDWETFIGDKRIMPSWEELSTFLIGKIHALEAVEPLDLPSRTNRTTSNEHRRNFGSNFAKVTKPNPPASCSFCGDPHYIGYCKTFKQKNPQQRKEEAIRLKLCLNCLKQHPSNQCPSPHRCSICNNHHHSLLHPESSTSPSSLHSSILTTHSTTLSPNFTLLATAVVRVQGPNGKSAVVRTLLDQGSEATFMSENLAQYLRLPRSKVTIPVLGMGSANCGTVKSMVRVQLSPVMEGYNAIINANVFVLPQLIRNFQPPRVDTTRWSHLNSLIFSDSQSQISSKIELVIGADVYGYALLNGLIKGPPGTPVAQETIFGWVLSGVISEDPHPGLQIHNLHCSVDLTLSADLRRFWEIEEIPAKKLLTPEEEFCEEHFKTTHSRDTTGRFVVRLPRRSDVLLGESYTSAFRSFRRNELQRHKNQTLNLAYETFMQEYINLGHMKQISEKVRPVENFYLPHHAVWKQEGEKPKIRVVFNASARSASGNSLNDTLLPGPKLQQDLSHILLRWRKFPVVFSADIVKMFRQILVDSRDQPLQRILWRNSADEELKEFQLQTVTYGTACAPFLAIRCLLQLASEEESRFPKASASIQQQTYVDDILTGADTVEEALDLKCQLQSLLMAGGFELAKWSSNISELAPNSARNHILSDGTVKTLGIHWNPDKDIFGFQVKLDNLDLVNKRSILSCIARLFDPLGWLAPVLITAKLMIQDLWSLKTEWDARLPKELEDTWLNYFHSLQDLQEIQIPRWIQFRNGFPCEIHGFCDASQRAYAASVYLRTEIADGIFQSHLLAAKTKVAPLKVISLPRLELSGAVLLIRLLKNTYEALQLATPPCIHAWTDSQVVLHWINAVPARWKCFVANRVSEIHQTLPQTVWHHISSSENPADPASRGIPAASIKSNILWWHGPHWLSKSSSFWPTSTITPFSPEALLEENLKIQSFQVTIIEPWKLLERYSSLTRLIRVTSWLFRFANNARTSKENRHFEPLSTLELTRSCNHWIKTVQEQYFPEEINTIKCGKVISKSSCLIRLHPFLDNENILRVGGRLENAPLTFNEKHPIILSSKSYFSTLLVLDFHLRTLHGGPQLTLSLLARNYWIVGGKNLVKKIIRTCTICFRYSRQQHENPVMGQLPSARVTPARPFLHCGVDYAGPLTMKRSKGRGGATLKGYIALFVCMTTKAIHLEAVSDYSTAAFLAAFKRFVSRRGIPANMYSDQGTNFRGANTELKNLFARASAENAELADLLATDGTQWHFIPPHSPHFGGLWEAGVKSVKTHLRKVIGDTALTYEELSTVLAEIEACLNSRPLTPLSTSPQDPSSLTPGHFLIGSSLKITPEPSLLSTPDNRLTRWQLLRKISEQFWRRWSREYIHQLQQRQKWLTPSVNLKPDDVVLIREDNLPPSKWRLGRILQVHPGDDGIVRVVTLRTSDSTYKRPVVKLCKLPLP